MQDIWQDARYGLRLLKREPGFALVAALTIALGIGATTTLFSVANGVLLKPLPWPNASSLMSVTETRDGRTGRVRGTVSNGTFLAWQDRQPATIDGLAGWLTQTQTLTGVGDPERLHVIPATPSLFTLLDAHPLLGRLFDAGEGARGQEGVVLLSFGLWQTAFGGRKDVVGGRVQLDGKPFTIVGVMPREFAFPDRETRAWTAWSVPPVHGEGNSLQGTIFRSIARLRRGVTPAQASAEATAAAHGGPDMGVSGACAVRQQGSRRRHRHTAGGRAHGRGEAGDSGDARCRRIAAGDGDGQRREPAARTLDHPSSGAGDSRRHRCRRRASRAATLDRERDARARRRSGRPCAGRGPEPGVAVDVAGGLSPARRGHDRRPRPAVRVSDDDGDERGLFAHAGAPRATHRSGGVARRARQRPERGRPAVENGKGARPDHGRSGGCRVRTPRRRGASRTEFRRAPSRRPGLRPGQPADSASAHAGRLSAGATDTAGGCAADPFARAAGRDACRRGQRAAVRVVGRVFGVHDAFASQPRHAGRRPGDPANRDAGATSRPLACACSKDVRSRTPTTQTRRPCLSSTGLSRVRISPIGRWGSAFPSRAADRPASGFA